VDPGHKTVVSTNDLRVAAKSAPIPTEKERLTTPNVSLEEVDEDGVVLRVSATPLRPDDGSQLAEEVLAALKPAHARSG
jgi:hypothetical protein